MARKGRARGKSDQRGEKNVSAKLTDQIVADIRNSGETARTLAPKYGVSESLIYSVRLRQIWKHVT